MSRRVKVVSDGTAVGTTVLVDGKELPVVGVDLGIYAPLRPGRNVTLTLDLNDVELDIVTDRVDEVAVCGAPHPEAATLRCEEAPHGAGRSHAGQGYVWRDER